MQSLIDGVGRFQQLVVPTKAALFARLAHSHNPATLFISCSDARVVPELITQSELGELFVIRTAGNLVPAYAPGAADGVAASIEYAVAILGVSGIVICGHSACGAMTALAEGHDLAAVPAVADWVRDADASKARIATAAAGADNLSALVSQNVIAQLANLTTHPSVAAAFAQHTLALHGWVYDIGTGTVSQLDPVTNEFIAISSEPPSKTSARTTSDVGFAPAEPVDMKGNPMVHAQFDPAPRQALAATAVDAKIAKNLSWQQIADAAGLSVAFTTAAIFGQHPLPKDAALAVAEVLGVGDDAAQLLQTIPTRGGIPAGVPTDPTIYRFYEMLQVYGTTLKALVHEQFGDGIISAINFKLDVKKVPDPEGGERAVITLDGKYLPTRPF